MLTVGKAVDHIVPKAEGGNDDEGNLQTICRACHAAKTADEARRGIDRGWGAKNL
jgi:5-methylcytosine-specific restriction protein A